MLLDFKTNQTRTKKCLTRRFLNGNSNDSNLPGRNLITPPLDSLVLTGDLFTVKRRLVSNSNQIKQDPSQDILNLATDNLGKSTFTANNVRTVSQLISQINWFLDYHMLRIASNEFLDPDAVANMPARSVPLSPMPFAVHSVAMNSVWM